jgi:hypothetical protein
MNTSEAPLNRAERRQMRAGLRTMREQAAGLAADLKDVQGGAVWLDGALEHLLPCFGDVNPARPGVAEMREVAARLRAATTSMMEEAAWLEEAFGGLKQIVGRDMADKPQGPWAA